MIWKYCLCILKNNNKLHYNMKILFFNKTTILHCIQHVVCNEKHLYKGFKNNYNANKKDISMETVSSKNVSLFNLSNACLWTQIFIFCRLGSNLWLPHMHDRKLTRCCSELYDCSESRFMEIGFKQHCYIRTRHTHV